MIVVGPGLRRDDGVVRVVFCPARKFFVVRATYCSSRSRYSPTLGFLGDRDKIIVIDFYEIADDFD